jgi:hypothetical protein
VDKTCVESKSALIFFVAVTPGCLHTPLVHPRGGLWGACGLTKMTREQKLRRLMAVPLTSQKFECTRNGNI